MDRYFVDTEHIRGEPRVYWVADRNFRTRHRAKGITDGTTDKRKAERECDKLNAAHSSLPPATESKK